MSDETKVTRKRCAKFPSNVDRSKEINFLGRTTHFLLGEADFTHLFGIKRNVSRYIATLEPANVGVLRRKPSQRRESKLNSSGKLYDLPDKAQLTRLNESTSAVSRARHGITSQNDNLWCQSIIFLRVLTHDCSGPDFHFDF